MSLLPTLPITPVLPALQATLATGSTAVLVAPPGAGKTTLVPLALLDAPWLAGQRLLLLEPRRLAARAAATRMAALRTESVGATVGWRMRGDTRCSARTRIEVVTEGVLTRLLLDDPTLDGVGAVLFDEFHERSIHGDTGLALARQTQQLLRPDLRLLVMSATIDGARVAQRLDDAPVLTSEGRAHPVTITHAPPRSDQRMEAAVAAAVRDALASHPGDLLAFLPGVREILRTADLLEGTLPAQVTLHPLFGAMATDAQDAALAPASPGHRKVVLASAIAETSLTIEGVRIVVDSGWSRIPRYSARTGMTRLETVRVTRASADQRAGRAGRTAPGICVRCWSAGEDAGLRPFATPEILEADLVPLALDLAGAGVRDAEELTWLDAPPRGPLLAARALLTELGALDATGALSTHGETMARLGVHPRLAHMLAIAQEEDLADVACDVAAILEERDCLRADEARQFDPDLSHRVEVLRHGPRRVPVGMQLDRAALERARQTARTLRDRLGVRTAARDADVDGDTLGRLVALAFPDRVALRRAGDGARFLLRNGSGATLRSTNTALASTEWIACAALEDVGRDAAIALAAPLDRATVRRTFAAAVERALAVDVDLDSWRMRAVDRERLGAITLGERVTTDIPPAERRHALVRLVQGRGLDVLPWSDGARSLRARLAFAGGFVPGLPAVDDATLLDTLDEWLGDALATASQRDAVDVHGALLARVPWALRAAVDRVAPTHVTVPTGSRIPVDYADPTAPTIAVRLQELFGATVTPSVAEGRVPLTLHLLSPAHRPVQVTRDLPGFWRSSYADVRRDLRGRYPRHPWPEDPTTAEPTRRAKPRGT